MISIVIPVFNQHDMTDECLRAVLENTTDCEVILIDNGSNPPTKPPFSGFTEIKVIRNEENKGFPAAVNQGMREARGDIIILLNNDVIVTPHWADNLARHLAEYDIVGPVTNFCAGVQRIEVDYETIDEMDKFAEQIVEEYEGETQEVNFVIGFCMAFKKELVCEIGEFDESMWPASGEEVDFCFRARKVGHKIGIVQDVFIHHEGSMTFKDLQEGKVLDYADFCGKVEKHLSEKYGDYWKYQVVSKNSYLIFAPEYKHNSAGIRVLYELRKHLEAKGYEARIVEFGSKGKASPDDIVIYPEIISGNPLGGKTVVRYVLNKPGLLGGDKEYNEREIIFAYHNIFYSGAPVLTVPCIEEFFKNENLPRSGECFWVGKGRDLFNTTTYRPIVEGMTEITYEWPATREELAKLLNEKEIFCSYDNCTSLIAEAKKCGCKVVIIGEELPVSDYDESIKDFDKQLDYFIEVTQKACQQKDDEIRLAIGVPLTFPFVPSAFFKSYALMHKPDHVYIQADNGGICGLRNNIVERALYEGCTHLIMMDTDQIYPADTIPRLLAHNLPVVGARVHRRYPPYDSLMLRIEEVDEHTNKYVSVDDWEEGELVEVDATGGGCVMFNLDVFRKLPYPWFKDGREGVGEDIGLCQDLKAAGYRIFVDSSIEVGHMATMVVNRKTNLLYRSMKEKQHQENLKKALQVA